MHTARLNSLANPNSTNGRKRRKRIRLVKTPVANLVRYKPSGIYFARVRIRGKLFRQTLNTDVMSVAKLRLEGFVKEKLEEMGDDSAVRSGKLTVGA